MEVLWARDAELLRAPIALMTSVVLPNSVVMMALLGLMAPVVLKALVVMMPSAVYLRFIDAAGRFAVRSEGARESLFLRSPEDIITNLIAVLDESCGQRGRKRRRLLGDEIKKAE